MKKIQFTKDGYDQLLIEYKELVEVRRPASVSRLQKARAMGDLSENSEYHAAKEDMAFVEGRIREIETLMKNAEVVAAQKSDWVEIGTTVILEKNGKNETYSIVGEFEADPLAKKLSATSPIGKALLGKKEGDTVAVEVPAGKLIYKIIRIE